MASVKDGPKCISREVKPSESGLENKVSSELVFDDESCPAAWQGDSEHVKHPHLAELEDKAKRISDFRNGSEKNGRHKSKVGWLVTYVRYYVVALYDSLRGD
jgi:hypothetical protein